jgi:hypothetical protein
MKDIQLHISTKYRPLVFLNWHLICDMLRPNFSSCVLVDLIALHFSPWVLSSWTIITKISTCSYYQDKTTISKYTKHFTLSYHTNIEVNKGF